MKYVTFNQALLAVGLVGVGIALTYAVETMFAIASAVLVEDGPAIAGPIALFVVSLGIPLSVLFVAWRRMGTQLEGDEGARPLTYPQARLLIGLAGLILLSALAPHEAVAEAADGNVVPFIVAGFVSLFIMIAIIAPPLLGMGHGEESFSVSQVLTCLGLVTLVVAAAVMPYITSLGVALSNDGPVIVTSLVNVATWVYQPAAILVALVVLLALRIRGDLGIGQAILVAVFLMGISASVHLSAALLVGLPLMGLAVAGYIARRADGAAPAAVPTGLLLTLSGLLSLLFAAVSVKYVLYLYDVCSPIDVSLFLWPTLALLVAALFGFGVLGVGVWKLRATAGAAE